MAMFERERERVSHLLSHFDLISSSKLAFDEKVTFDWMISLVCNAICIWMPYE